MILLLHTANASRRPHLAALRHHAKRVALIQRNPTWERDYVDEVIDVDTSDLDACVAAATSLAEREPVDAVLALVEHSVTAAAVVADALGLPGVSRQAALLARDKYRMRAAFAAAGLPSPRFALVRSVEEAQRFGEQAGYPVVAKPLIGGGSMYVRRLDSAADAALHIPEILAGAWQSFDYDPLYASLREEYQSAILVEEYLPGQEVSVESLTQDGRTVPLTIHDKPLPMDGPFFEEIYYSAPSRLPETVQNELVRLAAAVNEALGIRLGATHAEFRVAPNGQVSVLEVAARIGGGPVYQSVRMGTGVDMVDAVLRLASGQPVSLSPLEQRPRGFFMFFAEREGEMVDVHGVDAVAAHQGVSEVAVYPRPGDWLGAPPRIFQAHGHVVFSAPTMDDVDASFRELRDAITFTVR